MPDIDINHLFSLIYLLPIGIVVGVISALLGIGGGLLYVPALAAGGATPLQCVATSLLAIGMGAISGTLQNWKMKTLKIESVSLLTFPAMLTTQIGVGIATAIPSKMLLLSFAALQLAAIALMNLKNQLQKNERTAKNNLDRSTTAPSIPIIKTQGIGLVAGVLSGLFGVGGGIVMVPLQVLILKMSVKESVQTSYGAIVLIALWAVAQYAIADSSNILLFPGLMLGLGSVIGAYYGAKLLPQLSDKLVRFLFTGLLVILSSYMSYKALAL